MSFKYLGYDVAQMLAFTAEFSCSLEIEKCGKQWEVEVIHNNGDVFNFEGSSLSSVVVKAFKPFREKADNKRLEIKGLFSDMDKSMTTEQEGYLKVPRCEPLNFNGWQK